MGSRKGSHRSNKRKGVSRGRINAKNSSGPISSKHGSDPFANYTLQDLLKGKRLEIITAALLLSGKLKVDAVTFFRGSTVIQVGLLGQLNQKGSNNNNSKSNALADFLAENGDLTIDDIIAAFQKRMKQRRR